MKTSISMDITVQQHLRLKDPIYYLDSFLLQVQTHLQAKVIYML